MMRLTKHIFPSRMCLIASMNVKGQNLCHRVPFLLQNAGFTGVRLGFTVIPKDLKSGDVSLHALWARRHGTKYNGAPYIVQRAGEAVYSAAGKAQLKEQVAYYMNNAHYILNGLKEAGFTVSGGVNAPISG